MGCKLCAPWSVTLFKMADLPGQPKLNPGAAFQVGFLLKANIKHETYLRGWVVLLC